MFLLMRKLIYFSLVIAICACADDSANPIGGLSGTGTGGSLASFLVTNNNLYVLAGDELLTYNLENENRLLYTSSLKLPSLLETIAPYENYLFLGSSNAVHFLNRDNPDQPQLISTYQHFTACDPVVAKGSIAYSTIRSTGCRGATSGPDLLDAIDISDISNPRVLYSRFVDAPYGLAINDDFLFVCENGGISVFSTSSTNEPVFVANNKIGDGVAYDIILKDDFLIVVTSEGIFNVTYDLAGNMQILGQITS